MKSRFFFQLIHSYLKRLIRNPWTASMDCSPLSLSLRRGIRFHIFSGEESLCWHQTWGSVLVSTNLWRSACLLVLSLEPVLILRRVISLWPRSSESSLEKLFAYGESPLAVVTVKELVGVSFSVSLLAAVCKVSGEDFKLNCLFSSSTEILLGSPV